MSWEGVIHAIVSATLGCICYSIGYNDGKKTK